MGIFQNLIEGGWKGVRKKKKKKTGHVVGTPLDIFKTLYEKILSKEIILKKSNANIKLGTGGVGI